VVQRLENWAENFVFLAINDGSIDGTLRILKRLRKQLGARFEILSHENRGHGQSCLQGYRIESERKIPWVLQIDSVGQCDPQYFFQLWRDRKKFDVTYGFRSRCDGGWRRVLASWVLRGVFLATAGVWCIDANVPYRLMKTLCLPEKIRKIPANFFLANVGLRFFCVRISALSMGLFQSASASAVAEIPALAW
jgi:dolichol-phosphate mannosyltransferase